MGGAARSAVTTSRARVSSSLRNSTLVSSPRSWRSLRASRRAKLFKTRFVQVCSEPPRDLYLDLIGLFPRIWRAEDGFEELGVEYERLEIVTDGVYVDMLVNQFNRFGTECVPQQTPGARREPHRFVHMREPSALGLVRTEDWVG